MSFLKKYKSQFDDAKKKYMPKEEAHSQPAYADQSHQYGDPSQQQQPLQNNNNNNNLTPAVPPGWTPIWDPHSSQWTYQNAATGQIQTAHPDPANYGGQAMPPGGSVLDKDGKPKKDKNGLLMGAAGGVAGGMLGKWALKKAGFGGSHGHGSHGHGSHGHGSHGHGSHGHGGHGHGEHGGHEEGHEEGSGSSSDGGGSDGGGDE